jgi:hypothetical protein
VGKIWFRAAINEHTTGNIVKTMRRTWLGCCAALLSISASAADDLPPAAKTNIEYGRNVEPILAQRCHLCDGAQQQMNRLRCMKV